MRICIIITGGTIGSAGQPLAPMPPADFAQAAERVLMPSLAAALPDLSISFDPGPRFGSPSGLLDSTNLEPGDWCLMARHLLDRYDRFDGFVILHGTDSMDFSAAALSMMLQVPDRDGLARAALSKPVILTGAQLPLFRDGPDGPVLNALSDALGNVIGALAAARLRLPEVGLFFNTRLMRGNRALKISSTRFDAFTSPHLPPLAETGIGIWHGPATPLPGPAAPDRSLDDPDTRARVKAQLDAIEAAQPDHRVAMIAAFPGNHRSDAPTLAALIDAAVGDGCRGLVIEGYGEGNVPAGDGAIEAALHRADAAGVTTVLCSRLIDGQVGQFHYAAGAWIARTGAISGLDMTPVAGFAKLSFLLSAADHHGWSRQDVHRLIQISLAGECRAADRLYDGSVLLPGQALMAGGASLTNDPDRGPRLCAADGRVIWSAGGPGRLLMRDGVRVVGPDGRTLWRSGQIERGVLILTGGDDPALTLHDPAGQVAPVRIDG